MTLANVGDQCTLDVTFQPGSTGSDNGTLTINDDDLIDTTDCRRSPSTAPA